MAAAVGAITAAAFLPVLSAAFVNFDDDRVLTRNPYFNVPWPERFAWMWSTLHMGHYQPLTWMSLSFDHALGGWNPAVYHADSLLLHVAAALALYALILEILSIAGFGRDRAPAVLPMSAAAAALFWAVHPLRVESVAWIAERRDPLSALFYFLALLAYVRSVATGEPELRSRGWYFASIAAFIASLLAKAWAISMFAVLVVLDWYPLARLPRRVSEWFDRQYAPVWIQKVPFAAAGFAFGVTAWIAQRTAPDTMVSIVRWTVKDRILQALYGLGFYPAKTVWPTRLAALYELPSTIRGLPPLYLASAVAVAIAAVVIIRARQSMPWLLAAAACYVVIVVPVLGGAQSGPQLVADRYSYVSCAPFSVLLAAALVRVRDRAGRALQIGTALVLAALAILTWRQSTVWHDSITLWSHALDVGQPSYVAHLDLGQALRANGRIDEAIDQYRQALAIRPDAGNAWYNLANALKAKGDSGGAERSYGEAIRYLAWKVDAYLNLGNLYYSRGELPQAIAQYRAATAVLDSAAPEQFNPEPYLNLGIALADSGDAAGARQALNVAYRYAPTRARAQAELKRLGG